MQLQDDYFASYRSLKLTRDADGVLVVEFHAKGGPFRFTAQDHTEFVDAFYRIAQDRERGCDLPRYSALRRRHCARRRNFYCLELSRWSRTSRGFLAEPT